MLRRLYIAAFLILAACQMMSPSPTPSAPNLQNTGVDSPVITPTLDPTPLWAETETNGVTIGCWQPSGWTVDTTDGMLLAEHTVSIDTGEPISGALIYIFVPEMDNLEISPDADQNFAMTVLEQVVANPEHTGDDVIMSELTPFQWGAHQAAYYLYTTPDSFNSIVIGIALPNDHERLVVINATMPMNQARQMRDMLPRILNDLTINGVMLGSAALAALPNPLEFPYYPHT